MGFNSGFKGLSPTCFGRFCNLYQGALQEYWWNVNRSSNCVITTTWCYTDYLERPLWLCFYIWNLAIVYILLWTGWLSRKCIQHFVWAVLKWSDHLEFTYTVWNIKIYVEVTWWYVECCLLYTVCCILYTVRCMLYTVCCIIYDVYSILYAV